jgi:hypothetical protein
MAKAHIATQSGTTIDIEGTPEEVAKIVASVGETTVPAHGSTRTRRSSGKTSGSARRSRKGKGPTQYVLELKEEGFFKQKRSLNDVRLALEQKGHIYARTSLSPILLNLTKSTQLGRVKDGSQWAYVHRS